jgi:hypothetical protein
MRVHTLTCQVSTCTHRPISNTHCFSMAAVICKHASLLHNTYISCLVITPGVFLSALKMYFSQACVSHVLLWSTCAVTIRNDCCIYSTFTQCWSYARAGTWCGFCNYLLCYWHTVLHFIELPLYSLYQIFKDSQN